MPLVTRFETPGSLRDAPDGSTFYDDWHRYVADLIEQVPGDSGGEFVDPSEVDFVPSAGRTLVWMGFPRDLMVRIHRDDRAAAFDAGEDRAVQEEYLEWHVTKKRGKITKVTFVTETPDYWKALAERHRDRVLQLYRELVSPRVREADLFPGGGAYDPRNKWNTTKGIVHYIQKINSLREALRLAQRSVNSAPALDNYDVVPVDQTSADPRVQLDIGTLARKGLSLTLAEPIGIYIAGWDDTGWTKPDGSPVGNYWAITRGIPGAALRVEYAVPPGEVFAVGDIRIGGRPIRTGGEIAEHLTVMIRGAAGRRG